MPNNGLQPGPGYRGRAEQALLPFDHAHHEIARLEPPINVPLSWLVAAVEQHFVFRFTPVDWKLVLFRVVADAAEIEDHDCLQRMLSFRVQHTVVDELHDAKETNHGR